MPWNFIGEMQLNYAFTRFPYPGALASVNGELLFKINVPAPLEKPCVIDYKYVWLLDGLPYPDSQTHTIEFRSEVLFNLEAPPYLRKSGNVFYDMYFRLNPVSGSPANIALNWYLA